ncbi:hypothetical protein JJV70_13260 [Streptomyces sp. JJ66]|uniref:hypothetical protein n=1 Tax=Streptomyces sp. JJ66 TaxID=2803843 RepID=UPI001C5A26D6|nr:hypothetical protein [Streptomyces sp. JJ66]MBW1603058.1 hypothetical protein [Streptomyces sp. JJ66]
MRVEMVTRPGAAEVANEDYVSAVLPASGRGGALVLLDGVTPPPGGYGCVHDVPWYTTQLGTSLLELSGSRRDMPLARCLREAITLTAAEHASTCDLSHARTPQATVIVVRWDENVVEHLVLSDSVLLVESASGEVTPILDDRLDLLRPTVRGLATAAERAARIEALRNVSGGFHTAAADPAVADRAVTGVTPRTRVRTLAALTDGAARWSDVFGLGDWTALATALRERGPAAVIDEVRAAEAADPHGAAHPRGKPHDDATAALVEF